ncbi:hypothetical protein RJ639_020192 [Escallonia herrerae]|uniref:tRNA-binding domain-containing protein n=1 Tax=Escallonia herrerae TaxID=1293975 RepID=A0AA88V9Y7_9ASTE|nr:hypothetical protein RJ639_020192 [Escallonia herrerae]
MMAAQQLTKGSGLYLLSYYCSRTSGRGPLVSSCCSLVSKSKGNWTSHRLVSSSINNACAAAAVTRPFCSSNVAADSSAVPVTTNPVGGGDAVIDPITVAKDAANTLDMRVGHVIRAWRHEEADSLYVEEVDVGETESRIICSGLVNYIPLHHLLGKKVVVLANLKPRNMRGVKSCGMLMAASDASHENVELLVPPDDAVPGERVWFGSEDEKENLPDPATPNQIQKKKTWELVQPHLRTDASCVASLGVHFMRTSGGVVVCGSLKNANIS